jgi:hypothetical protein
LYLLRLWRNEIDNEKIAKNFDDDKEVIYEVATFLEDIGWMRLEVDSYLKMTRKSKINMITRHRPLISFRRANIK